MRILLLSFLLISPVLAAEKYPVPRFVSLKSNEINLRVGPGPDYPVEWIYVKAGLPVEIIAEFDNWRKIRDKEGTEGWIHQSMASGKRHGIIQAVETILYTDQDVTSKPLVRLETGVVVEVLKCRDGWCQIRISNVKGWVQRSSVWGVYAKENFG